MQYQKEKWVFNLWKSDTRLYVGEVKQDLFGQWILHLTWGGLHNRLGNTKTVVADTYDDATILMEKVAQRRIAHGYRLVG